MLFSLLLSVLQIQRIGQIQTECLYFSVSSLADRETYSPVCGEDGLGYAAVKAAVLKAYELVPEAYCQKIRNWLKGETNKHQVHLL